MGIPYACDHIGKRAMIKPMSDFRPYRAPARPPLGNAGRARLSGDYQQDANTLDQRLRHCLIKTLMGKRQTVPTQGDRSFRPRHAAPDPPLPATVSNGRERGPDNRRMGRWWRTTRQEERRVGKEWVSTCRYRRTPYH